MRHARHHDFVLVAVPCQVFSNFPTVTFQENSKETRSKNNEMDSSVGMEEGMSYSLSPAQATVSTWQRQGPPQHKRIKGNIINSKLTTRPTFTISAWQSCCPLLEPYCSPWFVLCAIHVKSHYSQWHWAWNECCWKSTWQWMQRLARTWLDFNVPYKYNLSYDRVFCQIRCQNNQLQNVAHHVTSYSSVGNAWVHCKYWVWWTISQSILWRIHSQFSKANSLPTRLPIPCETTGMQ